MNIQEAVAKATASFIYRSISQQTFSRLNVPKNFEIPVWIKIENSQLMESGRLHYQEKQLRGYSRRAMKTSEELST
jgi:hypothetical protein